jgi:effector-binding domain-containing protein
MEVEVVDVPDQLVLGTRQTGKYEIIAQLIPKVFEHAVAKGAQIVGPPTFVCHEMSADDAKRADEEGNADVEIVVPIASEIEGTDDIKCYTLPGGKMAKIVYKGPFDQISPTYEKLFAWIGENGKIIVGPTREVYLNDPREVPPEELMTEIYAPIN